MGTYSGLKLHLDRPNASELGLGLAATRREEGKVPVGGNLPVSANGENRTHEVGAHASLNGIHEHGIAGRIDCLAVNDNLATGDDEGVEAAAESVGCLARALLNHERIALLLSLLLAEVREASILAGAILAAWGRGRPGPDSVDLDILVEVRSDVVRLLAASRPRVLDFLDVRC